MHTLIFFLSVLLLPLASLFPAPGPMPPIMLNIVEAEPGKVVVSANDGNGTPLTNLTVDQFSAREDDGADQKIGELEGFIDPAAEVSIVLAIDVSGSMAGKPLTAAKSAAESLIKALGLQDRVAVLAFASNIEMAGVYFSPDNPNEQDYSLDRAQVTQFLSKLRAGGNTALYDAALRSVQVATLGTGTRRAVILITDGRDEKVRGAIGSGSAIANSDSAIFEATRYRIPVFTVAIGRRPDKAYLKRLALLTGGDYQETSDADQLAQMFQNVLNRLKLRYRLTYPSTIQNDGNPHRIRVALRVDEDMAVAETNVISATGAITDVLPVDTAPGWEPLPALATPQPETATETTPQSAAEAEATPVAGTEVVTPTEALAATPEAGAAEAVTPTEVLAATPEAGTAEAVTPTEALAATPEAGVVEPITSTEALAATPEAGVAEAVTPTEVTAPTPEAGAIEPTAVPFDITSTGTLTGMVVGSMAETVTPTPGESSVDVTPVATDDSSAAPAGGVQGDATPAAVAGAGEQPAVSDEKSVSAPQTPAAQPVNESNVLPIVLLIGAAAVAGGALLVSRRPTPPPDQPPSAPSGGSTPPAGDAG